jgi:hypothetical protein
LASPVAAAASFLKPCCRAPTTTINSFGMSLKLPPERRRGNPWI